MGTVPEAIIAFLDSTTYEDAVQELLAANPNLGQMFDRFQYIEGPEYVF